jgi:hypothetical protein
MTSRSQAFHPLGHHFENIYFNNKRKCAITETMTKKKMKAMGMVSESERTAPNNFITAN